MGRYLGRRTSVDVLGLSGKARSGKNFLAKQLIPLGFVPLALANQFKIDAVIRHGAPWDQVFGPTDKDPEVRNLLQKMGTEWGREEHGQDVWCEALELRMLYLYEHGVDLFVVTDVRFPNEVDWIHGLGGEVYRITGRGGAESEETQEHVSETALDGLAHLLSREIDNSPANEDEAPQDLIRAVREDFSHREFS